MIQIASNETKQIFVKYCNSLRCPLCKSQLDGKISNFVARLYCISDNNEYKCTVSHGMTLVYEKIKFYYSSSLYEIEIGLNSFSNNEYYTSIDKLNAEVLPQFREATRHNIFNCAGKIPFFRERMEEKVFLNKLKLYNVFS